MVGVAPLLGGLMLTGIFIKAFSDYNTTSTEKLTGGLSSGSAPRWRSASGCSCSGRW